MALTTRYDTMSKSKEDKDVLDLKNEITKLQQEINEVIKRGESSSESKIELSEVMDLKRRVDLMEKEFKKLSEALKNTLVDVRTLVTELDNPFNMLRSIGVDKLLEKVMEKAEEEISKAKKEELSKRVAKKALGEEDKEKAPLVVSVPPSSSVVTSTSNIKEVRVGKTSNREAEVKSSSDITISSSKQTQRKEYTEINRQEETPAKDISQPSIKSQSEKKEMLISKDKDKEQSIDTMLMKLKELISKYAQRPSPKQSPDVYTSLYTNNIPRLFLVSSYLLSTLGLNNAISLLSEYVGRGWISAKIVIPIINIMHMLTYYSPDLKPYENDFSPNLSFEDHIFILSALKSLEDPNCDQDLVFMLLLSKIFRIGLYFTPSKRGERS